MFPILLAQICLPLFFLLIQHVLSARLQIKYVSFSIPQNAKQRNPLFPPRKISFQEERTVAKSGGYFLWGTRILPRKVKGGDFVHSTKSGDIWGRDCTCSEIRGTFFTRDRGTKSGGRNRRVDSSRNLPAGESNASLPLRFPFPMRPKKSKRGRRRGKERRGHSPPKK